ncbi:serine/threonine protein kinase [Nitzschia inconspicua]|uniref:Serine/threonine protein kinase n=1 Tax=Nitzschia inconspicua TaxID=303405 RepID=A0A9K3KMK9_9STRA|nr:serine/threonine protein kinase [Nitzschia inconspicua]
MMPNFRARLGLSSLRRDHVRLLWLLCLVVVVDQQLLLKAVPVHATEDSIGEGESGEINDEDNRPDLNAAVETTLLSKESQLFTKGVIDHLFRLFLRKTSAHTDNENIPWWKSSFQDGQVSQSTTKRNPSTPYMPLKFFNLHRRVARVVVVEREDENDLEDQEEGLIKLMEPTVEENCHPGMTLHVFRRVEKEDNFYSEETCTESRTATSLIDPREEDPPRARSTVEILERSYMLQEPVQLELGVIPRHYLDFAYNPVLGREDQQSQNIYDTSNLEDIDGSIHAVGEDETATKTSQGSAGKYELLCRKHSNGKGEVGATAVEKQKPSDLVIASPEGESVLFSSSFSSWWKWWFPHASTWWKSQGSTQSDFQMGKSPFAGGSHGEVWRGRRVCRKESEVKFAAFMRFHPDSEEEDGCDDRQPVVLKRLKISRGYKLLEAGLREVYFGNLIHKQLEEQQQNLYTKYVDHFFREVPKRVFGRVQEAVDLELWIVFEDAGPSLRSYMYTATMSDGFVMYQHSSLWTQLRTIPSSGKDQSISNQGNEAKTKSSSSIPHIGRKILRVLLYEILSAAAILHQKGIVHRDIKPSNIMCKGDQVMSDLLISDKMPTIDCRLGDFSSGWDHYTANHLYTKGPSPWEQTDEYAPPESYLGPHWIPFSAEKPESYDSWSIGVTILELLLGTPNVFTVDQRTNALLTHKMERAGASEDDITHALYLAALSQFCIYNPSHHNSSHPQAWPLRSGDPLHDTAMAKESCTLQDFHKALRARDPLGIGFDSSADLLLHLIWQLLTWDPIERMTAQEALQHPYFTSPDETLQALNLVPGNHNALESQMLDPRMDFDIEDNVKEFLCPKCGRVFHDWSSCHQHANTRKHAKFCMYNQTKLPTCLNAHSMLPEHPTSGYCDLQGRRPTIEDFHSIHLQHDHQFYGIFDGHTGNLASKFVASSLYKELVDAVPSLMNGEDGLDEIQIKQNVTSAFETVHELFLEAVNIAATPVIQAGSGPSMDQSGTTATTLLVTNNTILVASLGDSRAVMSSLVEDDEMGVGWKDFPTLSAIQLTPDHVASDPSEADVVIAKGGSISKVKGGVVRVNGTLAITRSIGDALLAPVLSREPHILVLTRTQFQKQCGSGVFHHKAIPCFVILASDGLWDTMSNQEAVDMVVDVILRSSSDKDNSNNMVAGGSVFQDAAERLAVEAYVRGSTDNIGVCVVAVE